MRLSLALAALAVLGANSAHAVEQSFDISAFDLLGLKTTASAHATALPSTAVSASRIYLDGYNEPDASGDVGEGAPGLPSRTANFGYVSNSQVDLSAGTIAFHDFAPAGTPGTSHNGSGQASVELRYGLLWKTDACGSFGLEARTGRLSFSETQASAGSGAVTEITDLYQLGGVVPAPAPYSGSYTIQPGTQRIGDIATRTTTSATAAVAGSRHYSSDGWLVRMGIVWRPLDSRRVGVEVHAGPAVLVSSESASLSERWTVGSLPSLSVTGAASRHASNVGAYAGASVNVNLSHRWAIAVGADYVNAGKSTLHGSGADFRFDYSSAIAVNGGIRFRF